MTVWILTHSLGRTGVPITLQRYLTALPANHEPIVVIARRGGALAEPIAQLVDSVVVLEPRGHSDVSGAAWATLATIAAQRQHSPVGRSAGRTAYAVRTTVWRRRLGRLGHPRVAVCHGAGGWELVERLVEPEIPVVLHVHELALGLSRCIPANRLEAALARSTRLLAVSGPVADLLRSSGAAARDIPILPGAVVAPARRTDRITTLAAAGLDPDRPLVIAMGEPTWRKGADRYFAASHEVRRAAPELQMAWIGGAPSGRLHMRSDAPSPVRWLPAMDQPWGLAQHGDLFVLPSREDPLPLVALEAGLNGVAVLATPSGGLDALMQDGCGFLNADGSVGELAGSIMRIMRSEIDRARAAANLQSRVTPFGAQRVAPDWWSWVTP